MKKLVSLGLIAMFVMTLAACATTKNGEKVRVKCPACGYEFEYNQSPGN